MLGNCCPLSGAHLQNSQSPVLSPHREILLPFPSPGHPSMVNPSPGLPCAQPHTTGAGSTSSAQEWGKERWKSTLRLAGCSWGCRQISPTASPASPFPQRARVKDFNVSGSITNHLSCSSGFAQASAPPLALLPGHRHCEITTFAFPALDLLKCPRAPTSLLGASKQSWRAAPRQEGLFAFTGKPVNKGDQRDCSFPGCRNRWLDNAVQLICREPCRGRDLIAC